MKRYLYIAIGVVVLVIIVLLVVLAWKGPSPTTGTNTGTSGSLPSVGTQSGNTPGGTQSGNRAQSGIPGATGEVSAGKLGIISNELVLNYFVDASNTIITAQPDGKIEQISNGQSTYLSSSQVNNVLSADFSYDGKKILMSFGDVANPQWSVFDTATKAWTTLSPNPSTAAWSPTNYQVAYFTKSGGVSALQTLDIANAKATPKTLLSLVNQDFLISWPSSSTILLSDRSSALFSGSVFALNVKTGVVRPVIKNRVGLEIKWDQDGTMGVILAGTQLARGGQLGIVDNTGTLLHELTFLTLPSKCVFWSSATFICGVPRDTAALSGNPLPDAYEEMRLMTSDDIYEISLSDGGITPIFNEALQSFDVSNMKAFNGVLFFVNRYDQKLYALSRS